MTTVARPNRIALNNALDIYRDTMRPFIIRCLKRIQGQQIEDIIRNALNDRQADQFSYNLDQNNNIGDAIDVDYFPLLVSRNWRDIFSDQFKGEMAVQSMLWLIKEARNKAAHPGQQDMDEEFVRTNLYHIADVLGRINAPSEAQLVGEIRDQLVRSSDYDDNAITPTEAGNEPTTQQPRSSANLKPWREVIRPNTDVQQGILQEAEFAADLQQVYDGRANATNYGNPVSFINQTYITPGIRTLLVNTLKRLGGKGGDPVIQTKTGFGGGKTHSLIALYHLVNSTDALINPTGNRQSEQTYNEIHGMMEEAGLDPCSGIQARVAVLDGTYLSSTDSTMTREKGDPLNTLWGVMAYQLGGQDGYDLIGQAARQGTAPGGAQLDQLFAHVGPCAILIDELVAYVRNVENGQDNIYTFVQALTQSVRRNDKTTLVVTLPESSVEAGSDAGLEALSRLEHLLGRIEAVWEPLEVNEAFEVVRRRLFGRVIDEAARDRTCKTLSRMYNSRRDYPQGTSEQRYLQRMKDCYPIHPEIFDRLYEDWSSIPQFQRTRGVLRMMAHCVSRLYLIGDSSPLIMPGNLTLSDTALANEFVRLLGSQWGPVLSEVDSDGSRTDNIDRSYQRFANVGGAARRIARAVFLGSSASGAVKGIDARQIRLGVVQPGQGVSVYNEALNRMCGDLYYFYSSDNRYYFHAEENLNKVATDRAGALNNREINACIVDELREAVGRQSEVMINPQDSGAVPEKDSVRLVILPPDKPLPSRSSERDDATPEALHILQNRGDANRVRRNTLLFLTARNDEIRNLRNAVRRYLAWHSIVNGENRLDNLSGDRLKQAQNSIRTAESEVRTALVNAYRWAVAPVQDDPQRAEYRMNSLQINGRDTGEIIQSAFNKFIEEEALVEIISPSALANMLDQYVWNNETYCDHIGIDALWEMMTNNVYLHRLRNKRVLTTCIKQGVNERKFGYAESHYNDDYTGLHFGEPMSDGSIMADGGLGVLVNLEMAQLVKEETQIPIDDTGTYTTEKPTETDDPVAPAQRGPRRITTTKTMRGEISLDDVNLLRDEIIRNLRDDGGEITVSITINAKKPGGFSENTARSVRENSSQLGIDIVESD